MKDEALKLALEVLEDMPGFHADIDNAITAIKQALDLDKKAENARELGLDYESVQEPVACPCEIEEADFEQDTITLKMLTSEYVVRAGKHWLSTTPPAAQRQWVDLTPQDLNKIFKVAITGEGAVHFALAKFKELNT